MKYLGCYMEFGLLKPSTVTVEYEHCKLLSVPPKYGALIPKGIKVKNGQLIV